MEFGWITQGEQSSLEKLLRWRRQSVNYSSFFYKIFFLLKAFPKLLLWIRHLRHITFLISLNSHPRREWSLLGMRSLAPRAHFPHCEMRHLRSHTEWLHSELISSVRTQEQAGSLALSIFPRMCGNGLIRDARGKPRNIFIITFHVVYDPLLCWDKFTS